MSFNHPVILEEGWEGKVWRLASVSFNQSMCPVILEKDCEGKALEVASESFNQNMSPVNLEEGCVEEAGEVVLCICPFRGDSERESGEVWPVHLSFNSEETLRKDWREWTLCSSNSADVLSEETLKESLERVAS